MLANMFLVDLETVMMKHTPLWVMIYNRMVFAETTKTSEQHPMQALNIRVCQHDTFSNYGPVLRILVASHVVRGHKGHPSYELLSKPLLETSTCI